MVFTNTKIKLNAQLFKELKHKGENFLVVPFVAAVEGVMNERLVLEGELEKSAVTLNGRPLTIDHPSLDNGFKGSANNPDTVIVGRVFNAHMDGKKLVGEAWFGIKLLNRAGRFGREILLRVKSGTVIETSLGWYQEVVDKSGIFNGRNYSSIVFDLVHDHLAILLNDIGACSVVDGCGIARNKNHGGDMAKCKAKRPIFSGTEDGTWTEASKTFDLFINAFFTRQDIEIPDNLPKSIEEATKEQIDWIAQHSLLGCIGNTQLLLPSVVVNPKTGKLNSNALKAILNNYDRPELSKSSAKDMVKLARPLLETEFEKNNAVDTLLALFESALAKLLKKHDQGGAEVSKNMDEDQKTNTEEEEQVATFDNGANEVRFNELEAKVDTLVASVGVLTSQLAQNAEAGKDEVIALLVKNSKCPLGEDALKALNIEDLQKLANALKPASYAGNAGQLGNMLPLENGDEATWVETN